jgi:hypothetical protein
LGWWCARSWGVCGVGGVGGGARTHTHTPNARACGAPRASLSLPASHSASRKRASNAHAALASRARGGGGKKGGARAVLSSVPASNVGRRASQVHARALCFFKRGEGGVVVRVCYLEVCEVRAAPFWGRRGGAPRAEAGEEARACRLSLLARSPAAPLPLAPSPDPDPTSTRLFLF